MDEFERNRKKRSILQRKFEKNMLNLLKNSSKLHCSDDLFFRKIKGVELKRDTAAYYTSFYGRNFNSFQNWLCTIIFNWIFKNLWRLWSKTTKFWHSLYIHLQYQRIGTIYGILALGVGFGSMRFDFELLGFNVGHLEVNFRPLDVDFRLHGEF